MKKTIAIMITGALVASTAVTAFAAQNSSRRMITMEENTDIAATSSNQDRPELPEGMEISEVERPELPEGMEITEGERPELPEGMDRPEFSDSMAAGKYIPKLKPETKPDGEDMVPPEFEGIENIETLGKPELPEGAPETQFGGESRPNMQFGGEAPEEMNGGSRPEMPFNGEASERRNSTSSTLFFTNVSTLAASGRISTRMISRATISSGFTIRPCSSVSNRQLTSRAISASTPCAVPHSEKRICCSAVCIALP